MKKLYKAALLAALGLASVASVQAATSDLLLGFNDAAGPVSAQNDYVLDLGVLTGSLTVNSTFHTTIDLSAFNLAFGTDANALNNVSAGVVGSFSGSYPKLLDQTGTPKVGLARASFNNSIGYASAPAFGVTGSSTSGGWSQDTAAIASNSGNPLGQLTSGVIVENFYQTQLNSSAGTPTAWTLLGTFNINVNAGTVDFTGANVTAVPEPATYGLLAGAGLLIVSLRNKLSRKQA